MKAKKILFLITKATWGGAQKYVYDLATHLPHEQFNVVVAYGEKGKLADDLSAAKIEIRELPSLGRDVAVLSDIKSFFEILTCIRTTKPDVIHLNSSKAAALGALAARLAGVPKIVFTVHGWPFKEDRNMFARALIRFISWFTALLSHATIVVSKTDESIGKAMWLTGERIHYIPIGIDMPNFLSREEASNALKIKTEDCRIVTIAELTTNKGIGYAIAAIDLLKKRGVNVSYFVIGDGEHRWIHEKEIEIFGLSDCVHLLGFIPNAARYLKAFDVFVLPSMKEGMPYVLAEAAAAQLPIITTDVVDPMFLSLSFDEMIVKPCDSGAIADAIEATLKSDRTRSEFYSPLANMIQRTTTLY